MEVGRRIALYCMTSKYKESMQKKKKQSGETRNVVKRNKSTKQGRDLKNK